MPLGKLNYLYLNFIICSKCFFVEFNFKDEFSVTVIFDNGNILYGGPQDFICNKLAGSWVALMVILLNGLLNI